MTFPIHLKIIDIIQETPECKSFVFEKPSDFKYVAGQYITIQPTDDVTLTRPYSLSSIPTEDKLQITIKRVTNGFYSRWALEHLQVGDEVKVIGLYGDFTIKGDGTYIFFAAGSGIVPIYALIKELLRHDYNVTSIQLHYSSPHPDTTIFYHSLQNLSIQYPHFKIYYYFSQATHSIPKRLNNFDIPEIIHALPSIPYIYICGPIDYMDVIRINALTYGIPADNIIYEDFLAEYEDGYEGEERVVPEDTSAHNVYIHFNDKIEKVRVQYPQSILESALQQGIHLPYSCFSGQCGQCAARLIKGQVMMSYNQVLTDDELKNNIILTCQGFPIHGDAELDYQ